MRIFLLTTICAAGLLGAGPATPPKEIAFFPLGDRRGEVEPCGCPRIQLGGLQRLVAYVDATQPPGVPAFFLDSGNSFFSLPQVPESRIAGEKRKAELMADAYKLLGVQALVPGRRDLALGKPELDRLSKRAGIHLLSANLTDEKGKPAFETDFVFQKHGLRVGVVGVSEETAAWQGFRSTPAHSALESARKGWGKVDIAVAVAQSPEGAAAARELGFDIVLGPPSQPEGKTAGMGIWQIAARRWTPSPETDLGPDWDKPGRFAATYRRYLAALKKAAVSQAPPPSLKTSGKKPFVAQAQTCRQCHKPQYDFWAGTKHASAYLVLFSKDQHFNPECIACHSLGFQEPGGFSDIASPIGLMGQKPRAKGETPFVEKWMAEIFAKDPGKGDLDSRTQPDRHAALKKRYHAAVDKLQGDGKLQSLHMGVQCEHCHGNRAGHPSAAFGKVGKVTEGRCTGCHTPPHDESFSFAQRVPQVACPLMAR